MVAEIEKLRGEIRQKDELIHKLDEQLKNQQRAMDRMKAQMDDLLRRMYGRRSEKLDPNQLLIEEMILAADGESQAPAPPEPEVKETRAPKKTRKPKGRQPIPDHLPRHEIIIPVPEEKKVCPVTGKDRPFLGYEQTEKLEYIPETLRVNVYKREKYGSPMGAEENGVITAPAPVSVIDRCLADTGMLAHVAVSKFDDHMPLYRQERIQERQGVQLSRKTMAGWLGKVGTAFVEFVRFVGETILKSGVVHHDDTPVKMLDPGAGKTKETRLWVAVSGAGPPLVHFSFSTDRKQKTPIEYFKGYTGSLMCDEYAGYANVDCGILQGCWAHARRYVEKAQTVEPAFAVEVLWEIAKLYKIEKRMQSAPEADRAHIRSTESRAQVEKIFELLESREFRPQSPMHKAAQYALKNRERLVRFTEDPSLPIDNNPAERAIRRVAVGRKNWLFLGSETGGETASVLMSLLGSCWANRVNSWAYMKGLLDSFPNHSESDWTALLPHNWVQNHPEAKLPPLD